MSKAVKTIITFSYVFLFFQYLRISLNPVITEIDILYISTANSITKDQQFLMLTKYHNFSKYIQSFMKLERFDTDLKYVLKFTNAYLHYASPLYAHGQRAFIENNCSYYNCHLTTHRNFLKDLRDFDALLFDAENTWDGVIVVREPYQKYVFMASESADRFPMCDAFYDDFFNLTWTYRLDSDIQWTYFKILDLNGNFLGPKINMSWIHPMKPTPPEVKQELGSKTKAAAWFVSNCKAGSGRERVTHQIQQALKKYNLTVDTYGWCGTKKCPKDRIKECLHLLKTDYYFYLSFENSLNVDYVTEKILYPLNNYAVPIVFGGADYSRFLPPGSYINALELNATQVVQEMMKAIKNPSVYEDYFRWHNYYRFVKNPPDADLCKLCQILNEESDKRYWYQDFRKWWNPEYRNVCSESFGKYPLKKTDFNGILEIEKKAQQDMKR